MSDQKKPDRGSPGLSRRAFLKGSGAAVAATTLAQQATEAVAEEKTVLRGTDAAKITLNVNGKDYELSVEPRVLLLDVLRNDLNLTGCKDVDDHNASGADTVMIDGKPVLASSRFAVECEGKKIRTVESLVNGKNVDEVVTGFAKHDAMQCGFCTPGFVVATRAFLDKNPNATLDEIQKGLGGNLCRCGTYHGITHCALEIAKGGCMMAEREVAWKPQGQNSIIGTDVTRLDGIEKASGEAKYSADINTEGTLYGKILTCKEAHATIKMLDTSPAKAIKGVHAVYEFKKVGDELLWDGTPVVAVAAERPEIADDALRAIKVEYEPLEYWVDDLDVDGAASANSTKDLGDNQKGDVAAALESAKAVHEGFYGVAVITHMCMEPHGSHCEWKGDNLVSHLSTQNVSGTAGQFVQPLGIQAAQVNVICNYLGGGFGSKFAVDEWGIACAQLAKDAGRPVRLMLDRATELKIAGVRPSGFAKVKIAADADGKITAWESHHWGTNGTKGGTISLTQMPYIFDFDNRNRKATGIVTHTGPSRAWRAPNHPQLCAITDTAIDDLSNKLGMDPYDVFLKNLDKVPEERAPVYAAEMEIAAKLIGWKKNWKKHGTGPSKGGVKRGLGMAIHTWGGRAHAGTCTVKVHPDGTVESFAGSQDIGTGTRTVIAMTLAETFGLGIDDVNVHIGDSKYPRSGPSGGSTTVGGVTGPHRRAALEALWQIFDKVAEKYNVGADTLSAEGGQILSGKKAVCTWKQAASLVGPMALEVQGQGPKSDGLTDSGVAGVQMADVSVDTETGKVTINKLVAVQDCGLIIDMKTAKSQVYGGLIMGIAYALSEERIMDNATGRFINADLMNYKLPRIGDIGELVVEMYQPESEYNRGVIGLGEPPVISTGACISNAVANAVGVRVPVLPLTPQRVLESLKGGGA